MVAISIFLFHWPSILRFSIWTTFSVFYNPDNIYIVIRGLPLRSIIPSKICSPNNPSCIRIWPTRSFRLFPTLFHSDLLSKSLSKTSSPVVLSVQLVFYILLIASHFKRLCSSTFPIVHASGFPVVRIASMYVFRKIFLIFRFNMILFL